MKITKKMTLFNKLLCTLLLLVGFANGQSVSGSAGIQPFSTQALGPVSHIDLATGNVFVDIPFRDEIGWTWSTAVTNWYDASTGTGGLAIGSVNGSDDMTNGAVVPVGSLLGVQLAYETEKENAKCLKYHHHGRT